jgi:MurNAc alpha-1-phosphate uridylyltransferase
MKAMILAAGRGERLRPLTDTCPKPLLPVGDAPLIVHHLRALARAGFTDIVINTAWLAEQFERVLGDGSALGVSIRYSAEGATGLETGGGILHALPLLGAEPFLVVNGDIHLDFDFTTLHLREADCAQLLMVDPPDGGHGDFALDSNGRLSPEGAGTRLTYSGVAIIHPALFAGWRAGLSREEVRGDPPIFRLAPVLRHAMRQGRIGGQHHRGHWTDAGTPAALKALETRLRAPSKR